MKIKFKRLSETVLMSGPAPAATAGLPQAALGQRPSDAYKNGKVKLKKLRKREE